ncbi:MAG: hypothetical protein Q4G71_03825 [Pseudomonadota bacterium]|nr:hypothetical protein [Pseudomonadota bacterium]
MNTPHINDVRSELMQTLRALRDRDNPMEVERARAVAQVATVLVDSAKVENDYLKLSGQDRSPFLEEPTGVNLPRVDGPAAHNPFPTSVRHRLEG